MECILGIIALECWPFICVLEDGERVTSFQDVERKQRCPAAMIAEADARDLSPSSSDAEDSCNALGDLRARESAALGLLDLSRSANRTAAAWA